MFRVLVSSGVLCHFTTDFTVGWIWPLEFSRSFRSNDPRKGLLGNGWAFPFEYAIALQTEKLTLYEGPDPQDIYFRDLNPEGLDEKSSIRVEMDNNGISLRKNGLRFIFDTNTGASRFPVSKLKDAAGNCFSISYGLGHIPVRLEDRDGNSLSFVYDSAGRIERILLAPVFGSHSPVLARYGYSASGDLVSFTNRLGEVTRYEYQNHLLVSETTTSNGAFFAAYDRDCRCSCTWRSDGRRTRYFEYDHTKRETLVTDALGAATLYRFDNAGRMTQIIDCEGNYIESVFDSDGNLIGTIDKGGGSAMSLYSGTERELVYIDRTGAASKLRFLRAESAIEITDPQGNKWREEYSPGGLLSGLKSPAGSVTRFEYDDHGMITSTTTPSGRAIRYSYSDGYRTAQVSDELGVIVEFRFGAEGYLLEERAALEQPQSYEYDCLGRITSIRRPTGSLIGFEWSPNNTLAAVVESDGSLHRYLYNAFAECERIVDPTGHERRYEYDVETRITRITNEMGEAMDFEYDLLGRLTKQTFFDGHFEKYGYDKRDNLVSITDSTGTISFTADAEGRITDLIDKHERQSSFRYNACGLLVSAKSHDSQISLEYDPDGRVLVEKSGALAIHAEYDTDGNLAVLKLAPAIEFNYGYDKRGRLTRLGTGPDREHIFHYDLRDRPVFWQPPGDGISVEYRYHDYNRLKNANFRSRREALSKAYSWDDRGRLASMKDENGIRRFLYSALDQVVEVSSDGVVAETYRYDDCGNIIVNNSQQLLYAQGGRLLEAGSRSFMYDAVGLPVRWDNGSEHVRLCYDGQDRLQSIEQNGKAPAQFRYDPLGRRVAVSYGGRNTQYVWWGERLVAEWDTEPTAGTIYIRKPDEDIVLSSVIGGVERFFFSDQIGRPTHIMNGNGETVWSASYDLWGAAHEHTKNGATNPFRFPGQYFDPESGLTYNLHRYYDSAIGRFTTPDPVGLNGGLLNFYQYAPNPLNWIDASGLAVGTVQCSKYCSKNICTTSTKPYKPAPIKTTLCNPGSHDSIHNMCVNKVWARAQAVDPNARRDQKQVVGSITGTTRPDIQFRPPGGPPTFVEFDNHPYDRMKKHIEDICGNDSTAQIHLVKIPKGMGKSTIGGSTPTDAECGLNKPVV